MYKKIIDKLSNKKIAILGFGKEGKSTYEFIRRYSDQFITILDKNDILSNNSYLNDDKNLEIITGDNYLDNLDKYDLVIKSPGIALLDMDLTNVNITSQLELILEVARDNIIGITGTKGKSTTSTLLYEVIKDQNENTFLLGNIGNPIFDYIEKFNKDSTLVIEMSSHQLEYVKVSPHIGVVLNLYQDHLDHTGTLEKYFNDKMHMFKYQDNNDIAIYDGDNENLIKMLNDNVYLSNLYSFRVNSKSDIYVMDNKIYYKDEMIYDGNTKRNLIGSHNLKNIMVVLLICELLHLDIDKASNIINSFKPLEHRLEMVGTYNDITYFDDTIATIPEATINGIEGIGNVDTLIFGGMDRNIDYDKFIDYLSKCNVSNLIGLPDTGHKICNILKDKCDKNIIIVDTIDEAVEEADKYTKKGYSCLLSPAASSYNKFKNCRNRRRSQP